MTMSTASGSPVQSAVAHASVDAGDAGTDVPRRRKLGWAFWLSVGWLTLVVLTAVLANVLPLQDPNASLSSAPFLGPGPGHLFGTDANGRDVLARLIFGSRVSLVTGLGSVAMGMVVGGGLGIIAGYYGRFVDFAFNSAAIVFLSFPALILALALRTFLGQSMPLLLVITLALGIVATPLIFRIVRATTQTYAQREFVQAAKALGAPAHRILLREIVPNVAMTALSFVFIAVGVAIMAEAALSFLGVSVRPPTATWGNMVLDASGELRQSSTLWIWPSLALFFTVLALNVAGDKLRTFFGVRESFL